MLFEHAVDDPSQFVSQDRQGLALAVSVGELHQIVLGWFVVLEKEPRCFRERPLEMGVADLLAAGAVPFAVGRSGTLDQAAVGDELLEPGDASDSLNFIDSS